MKYWVLIIAFLGTKFVFADHVVKMDLFSTKVVVLVMGPGEKLSINYVFSVLSMFSRSQDINFFFKLTGRCGILPVAMHEISYDTAKRILKIPLTVISTSVQAQFVNQSLLPLLVNIERIFNHFILNATFLLPVEDGEPDWESVASPNWEIL